MLSMVNSIVKGKSEERKACHALMEVLDLPDNTIHRSQQHSGKGDDSADITGIPGLHFEVKQRKRIDVYDALKQATRDAKFGRIPVGVVRRDHEKWVIAVYVHDLPSFLSALSQERLEGLRHAKRPTKRVPLRNSVHTRHKVQ